MSLNANNQELLFQNFLPGYRVDFLAASKLAIQTFAAFYLNSNWSDGNSGFTPAIVNPSKGTGMNTPYGQQRLQKKLVTKRSLGYSKTFFINNIFFAN